MHRYKKQNSRVSDPLISNGWRLLTQRLCPKGPQNSYGIPCPWRLWRLPWNLGSMDPLGVPGANGYLFRDFPHDMVVLKTTSSQFIQSSRLNGAGEAKLANKGGGKGKSKGESKGAPEGRATNKGKGAPIRTLGPYSFVVCCVFMFC